MRVELITQHGQLRAGRLIFELEQLVVLFLDLEEEVDHVIERLELPFGFLPMEFTLGELQATCGQLLGRRLDKSSFRRRLAERDVIEPAQLAPVRVPK